MVEQTPFYIGMHVCIQGRHLAGIIDVRINSNKMLVSRNGQYGRTEQNSHRVIMSSGDIGEYIASRMIPISTLTYNKLTGSNKKPNNYFVFSKDGTTYFDGRDIDLTKEQAEHVIAYYKMYENKEIKMIERKQLDIDNRFVFDKSDLGKLFFCKKGVYAGLVGVYTDEHLSKTSGAFRAFYPVVDGDDVYFRAINYYIKGTEKIAARFHFSRIYIDYITGVIDIDDMRELASLTKNKIDYYESVGAATDNKRYTIVNGNMVVLKKDKPTNVGSITTVANELVTKPTTTVANGFVTKSITLDKSKLGMLYQFCVDNELEMK